MKRDPKTVNIKKFIFLISILFVFCVPPNSAQAKGNLVRIEHFSPLSFSPHRGETTVLDYHILRNSSVAIRICDLSGRRIFEYRQGFIFAGKYSFVWDGTDSFERTVEPGFYKCEIAAVSSSGDTASDYADAIVHVIIPGESLVPRIKEKFRNWSVKVKGFVRYVTEAETGLSFDLNHREVQLDLKGRRGDDWRYGVRFFPFYSSGQLNWSEFVEASAGYYGSRFSVETGYRNFVEGYADPLFLFSAPALDRSRFSVLSKINAAEFLDFDCGLHYITDSGVLGLTARGDLRAGGFSAAGFTLNSLSPAHTNNVVALEFLVPIAEPFTAYAEIGASRTVPGADTPSTAADSSGLAFRAELRHEFRGQPGGFGTASVLVAGEYVEKDFACDLAALPNGSDNYGADIILGYTNNFGLPWLEDMRLEVRKAYFRNMANTLQRQRFRPTVSVDLGRQLRVQVQYDYLGVEDITSGHDIPVSRSRNFFSEARYAPEQGGWDIYCSYATALNTVSLYSEYTVTRAVCGYRFIGPFYAYLGYDKVANFTTPDPVTWRNYNLITAGFRWDISGKSKTLAGLQAGLVIDNLAAGAARMVYYGEFSHCVFRGLSLGLTYGTPSGADAVQRIYVQAKYEF